jgi:acetophenone carboxylase
VTGEAARRRIAQLNDGVYRQPRFLDTVGTGAGLTRIHLAVIKQGDRITLDLSGTSPLVIGTPVNCFFQGIIGLAMVYFCGWLFHDLPANNGSPAVDWRFPTTAGQCPRRGSTDGRCRCASRRACSCGARMALAPSSHAVAAGSRFAIPSTAV